jgi:hypothetical protein
MTDTVTRQFVTQFDSDLRLLAQQKDSRLRNTVFNRGTIEGSSFTINNLDKVEMDENTVRHGDTIWSDIDHTARTVPMRDFFKALPLDRADIPKMKVNPVTGGQYMQQLVAARNRKIDDIIFAAALGSISSVDGSTGPYTLPAGQIIAAGGTGLTKAKIIQARSIFRANETDEEELFFLWDSLAMTQILSDTTLTSADYMAGKMIQDGNVAGKWLGFTWIPYERTTVAGAVHTTAAYSRDAIHFGMGFEEGDVAKRADKKNSLQVSMAGSYAAGRQDEKKVVQISFQ